MKRDAQRFAEEIIGVIDAKKQEIFNEVDSEEEDLLKTFVIRKSEIEHHVKMTDREIEQTETLLKRSTSAEVVQLDVDKSLNTISQEEVSNEREVSCDITVLRQLTFVESKTLKELTNTEGIDSFKSFPLAVCFDNKK